MSQGILCSINYGTGSIDYDLVYASRKTLEIAVHPDKTIVVTAPQNANLDNIEAKVKKRARWIKRQVRYFQQFDPRTPDKKYVGGESHFYLGRKYRLKITPSAQNFVTLKNGYLHIETTSESRDQIQKNLDAWYREKAHQHFIRLFDECWLRVKGTDQKPSLNIKKMKKRWGSLSKNGTLSLNVDLIQTPKECIEYVILHELCHLTEYNHGPNFYKLLDKTLPDWLKRKHKLEMSLI